MQKLIIVFLFSILTSSVSEAVTRITVQSGGWNNESIWSPQGIPTADDELIIRHTVDAFSIGMVEVANIVIENNSSIDAKIVANGNTNIIVLIDFRINSHDFNSTSGIELSTDAVINVKGHSYITRANTNNSDYGSFSIFLRGKSKFITKNNLTVYYGGTSVSEDVNEFDMAGQTEITIGGVFTKDVNSGNVFNWRQAGSSTLLCEGNYAFNALTLNAIDFDLGNLSTFRIMQNASISNNSSAGGNVFDLNIKGMFDFRKRLDLLNDNGALGINFLLNDPNAVFSVGRDLTISASQANTIVINLTNRSKLKLGGNLFRTGGFGNLNMSNDATFVYTGEIGQSIIDPAGAGTDAFTFSNIELAIPAGQKINLSKDFVISGKLELTSGIIVSQDWAKVIVNVGANLSGGSPSSYIEGPVKKIDIDDGVPFTFPLGHQGVYAPMTIETTVSRSAAKGEFTAKYLNCPPPWPASTATNIEQLSSEEFWELERSEGAADVNVRLHWTDAEAQGITNTDDLVVAMYNPDIMQFPTFPAGWTSIGQEGLVGGVGSGVSGSIMNIGICPPPWGIELFTFGSTSNDNSLPVDMETFNAESVAEVIELNFSTVNEIDVDEFILEKSVDGTIFNEMDRIVPTGVPGSSQSYEIIDLEPNNGINYYRIKKVDLDGMFAYTNIITVAFYGNSNEIVAFPNPMVDRVVIKGNWSQNDNSINIYDANGMLIYNEVFDGKSLAKTYNLEQLNIFKSGIYILESRSGSNISKMKLIKP